MTFDDENGLPPGLLGEMMGEVVRNNKAKGWYDESREWGDEITLLHSEVSEAFEAFRDHGFRSFKVHTEDGLVCEREGEGKECNALGKPEGVGAELADVFIRLLDTCARYEIRLEEYDGAKRQDWPTFASALAYLHFRISQFWFTTESRRLQANNIYRVLTDICGTYGIDLIAEYSRKTAYNLTRPYRHGGRAL